MTTVEQHENLQGTPARDPHLHASGSDAEKAETSSALVAGSTGPRTTQGKDRSKRNAVKHGIFAKLVVLKGESRAEFDVLLSGLRDDFNRQGMLEGMLVERLATLSWRLCRLITAEGERMRDTVNLLVVNDFVNLDILCRYEVSLDRALDRTLNQLERYQRMRLGQPVAPPINVNLSSS
jgi:hypothetical protein